MSFSYSSGQGPTVLEQVKSRFHLFKWNAEAHEQVRDYLVDDIASKLYGGAATMKLSADQSYIDAGSLLFMPQTALFAADVCDTNNLTNTSTYRIEVKKTGLVLVQFRFEIEHVSGTYTTSNHIVLITSSLYGSLKTINYSFPTGAAPQSVKGSYFGRLPAGSFVYLRFLSGTGTNPTSWKIIADENKTWFSLRNF